MNTPRNQTAHTRGRVLTHTDGAVLDVIRTQRHELAPAAVLPEQFYDIPIGVAHASGVVALIRAVLDDAIDCYQKQFCAGGRRDQRLAKEVEA